MKDFAPPLKWLHQVKMTQVPKELMSFRQNQRKERFHQVILINTESGTAGQKANVDYNVELLTGAGECKIQFDWSLNYRWKNRVFRTTRALRVINKISIEGISDEWASNLN